MTKIQAIKKSIEHWELILDLLKSSDGTSSSRFSFIKKTAYMSLGGGNSSYCFLCDFALIESLFIRCEERCIKWSDGGINCYSEGSPFNVWDQASNKKEHLKAARIMISFLKKALIKEILNNTNKVLGEIGEVL